MEILSYHHGPNDLVLCPLGDIQYLGDTGAIATTHLRKHIDRCLTRGGMFVGMGDYTDAHSPSNRQKLKAAGLYDNSYEALDIVADTFVHGVLKEYLAPTGGQWAGLLSGHHFHDYVNGTNSDQKLACLLGAPYGGSCFYLRVVFEEGNERLIWVHHGSGGGSKSYAPLQKLENVMPHWEADLFLMGHATKRAVSVMNRIRPEFTKHTARLNHKDIFLVGTGGWSKGYQEYHRIGVQPRGDYVELKMLNPVALGAPVITIPCDPDDQIRVEV